MATSIATGALAPKTAVTLSAVLNLVGAFLSTAVAATIAKGLVDANLVTLEIVFAGLVGGIIWNLLTWLLGIPSSSSHALIGGVIGAMLAAVGVERRGVEGRRVERRPARRAVARDRRAWSPRSAPTRSTARPAGSPRSAPSEASASARSARRRSSRWRTAPTTRRRRWASSSWRSSRTAASTRPTPCRRSWVIVSCAVAIAAGHLPRRLAHHPHARQGTGRDRVAAGHGRGERRRPQSSCWPATSASRCRPPTSRPARSSASGLGKPGARCAGAWRCAWSPRG